MKNIWIIADVPEHAYELLSSVTTYTDQATVFVNGDESIASECFHYGAKTVKLCPLQEGVMWEQYAKEIAAEGKEAQPELILVAATRRGKTIAAQIAALLDLPCITESKSLNLEGGKIGAKRTIFGGLAEKEVEVTRESAVVTVAPGTYGKQKVDNPTSGDITTVHASTSNAIVTERKDKEASTVNLSEANVVIGVGRGIGNKENLKYVEEIASILKGEIGCTRPITEDLKWYPEERYIGISGEIIKPNLYLAAGISGQIQHVYGIRDSKTIVAIDKNENAPIFQVADYYIVGDIEEVLPEIIHALN